MSFETAEDKVLAYLLIRNNESEELRINESYVLEKTRGWVFPYNTKLFLETKRPQDGLVGNGPLFVDRDSGVLYELPSGGWKRLLDEYDQTGSVPETRPTMKRIS